MEPQRRTVANQKVSNVLAGANGSHQFESPGRSHGVPGAPSGVKGSGETLDGQSPTRRAPGFRAREHLKKSGSPPKADKVGELIEEALYSPDPDYRENALSLLAASKPTARVFQVCLDGLLDIDADVRLTAVLAFDDLRDRSALPLLLQVAQRDPSQEVQEVALDVYESLANHGRF